jgi:DNA-binding MarR family transcriptional regulator
MGNKVLGDLHLSAWRAFITTHAHLIERIDRALTAGQQLPLRWYDVLIELYQASGQGLRMHELADRVVLSRSGLTRLVDNLEAAGLLARHACQTDRRGTYITVTDRGKGALRKAWPVYAKGIADHFARHLSEAEARTLADALTRVRDAAREP